ncbi:MAG: hypothetical protein V3V33_05875 [Candidatus Lokiarchaeia archaeon]
MEEINYKGLYVQASYGEQIHLVCFLFKPAEPVLKKDLIILQIYSKQIIMSKSRSLKKSVILICLIKMKY